MQFGERTHDDRFYPIITENNAHLFVASDLVEPWSVHDGEHATSALKFFQNIDLLGISATEYTDSTDSLYPDISLEKFFYKNRSGEVKVIDFPYFPYTPFFMNSEHHTAHMVLDIDVSVVTREKPKTIFGKWYRQYISKKPMEERTKVKVTGSVNLQTGTIGLMHSNVLDILPLGYTLKIKRTNYNRRPVESTERCPFLHN